GRQALHSASLDFIHPVSAKHVHVEAPLPEDMKNALASFR
ncbi:MAG: RluA family pseudouridine synthase, partial [Firmicutes bacterium]|nr:RluA family pseudouridine synthase [Bacillota bacterium]